MTIPATTSIEEALLLFDKWWQERTPITCTFEGRGLRLRFIGTVESIDGGSVTMTGIDETSLLKLPLHSVHEFKYCDPREVGLPEARERYVGFLIMRLLDGNVVHFAEPKE